MYPCMCPCYSINQSIKKPTEKKKRKGKKNVVKSTLPMLRLSALQRPTADNSEGKTDDVTTQKETELHGHVLAWVATTADLHKVRLLVRWHIAVKLAVANTRLANNNVTDRVAPVLV